MTRLAVVTGASSGLGVETAKGLAARGFTVVLAVRDVDAGEVVRASLDGEGHEVRALDLTSLESVRAFADGFLDAHDRLDLLVNNAGVMGTPFGRTADGFELQFGTNHLGHFLLTVLLAPALVAAAPSRVVNLTSAGHRFSPVHFDDPNYEHRAYDKWESYGQSKTANILFTVELERRLGPLGVHAYAVHPGMVATNLGRHLHREDYALLAERAKQRSSTGLPSVKTPEEGAATTLYAATSPDLEGRGGRYLVDEAVSDDVAAWAVDPDAAGRLWALSERLTGASLPR